MRSALCDTNEPSIHHTMGSVLGAAVGLALGDAEGSALVNTVRHVMDDTLPGIGTCRHCRICT